MRKFSTVRAEAEEADCCCNVTTYKASVITLNIVTTLIGAVVVGVSLTSVVATNMAPDVIASFMPRMQALTVASVVVGALLVILSIFGCIRGTYENSWATIVFVIGTVMEMAGETGVGAVTMFLYEETKVWINDQAPCDGCLAALDQAFRFLRPAAIVLLVTLLPQIILLICIYKVSQLKRISRRKMLIASGSPDQPDSMKNVFSPDRNLSPSGYIPGPRFGSIPSPTRSGVYSSAVYEATRATGQQRDSRAIHTGEVIESVPHPLNVPPFPRPSINPDGQRDQLPKRGRISSAPEYTHHVG